ncbi:VanZ family protein [Paenibacillus chitinolyticus]|uniref:VanZ family protein n=1 Tax=Paenibacillus chitinolyticus TaxID=79263 RepID=UPI002DB7A64C|nr:VanZ family protein [Paenibacillus chitinolyticus]MEC0244303.1 VanZ family protein [Paenibacillus chitinolyticus]
MSIQFTIESYFILIPLFLIFLVTLFGTSTFKKRKFTALQYILLISFCIYILAVIHLVFFPIDVNLGLYANQTPWYKTINFIPLLTLDIKTFVLNIFMLVPLGIYLPLMNPKYGTFTKAAKLALVVCLSIELLQLIIRITLGNGRSTDINDILANTLGGALGFLLYSMLMRSAAIQRLADRFRL